MNPSRMTIEGNYWDCQIYRGRLYLFTIEGSVQTIDWGQLVNSISKDEYLQLAIRYSFENGRDLYSPLYNDVLQDKEVKQVIRDKFEALNNLDFVINTEQLSKYLIGEQDNPFNELHVDSLIISNRLYGLTHNSLLSSPVHKVGLKYPISTRKPIKHFDLYAFTINSNRYAKLAISAGSDGLFEYDASFKSDFDVTYRPNRRMRRVSERHSSFSDYSFLSIYNSSLVGDSFLAYHFWKPEDGSSRKPEREKTAEYNENDIFKDNNYGDSYLSWGSGEKIYRAVPGGLQIVRFNNWAEMKGEEVFSEVKFIPLQPWKGKILSGATSYFGTILHCENAVVVIKSTGDYYNIPGDISRFRIYPRSINYENHLHVIHDNKLEVYSFNHDYFVNQRQKDFGMAFRFPENHSFYRNYNRKYVPDEDYYDFNDDEKDQATDSDASLPF